MPFWSQHTPVLKNRMMTVYSQYQIVPLPKPREIYIGVINDMVCAYRSRYIHISRTAYGSDFSPKLFGNLHCKCADAARCALNENFVARLNPSPVAKTLERSHCRDGYRSCVLKRQVGWLRRQFLFRCTYVFGKSLSLESCYSEDLVACLKLLYVPANCLYSAGDITTDDRRFWAWPAVPGCGSTARLAARTGPRDLPMPRKA